MFVMTIDQRSSRTSSDLVPQLLENLQNIPTESAFERSVGDEIQGVLSSAAAVVEVAMRCLRDKHWYVGIGIGPVDLPLPLSPREGSGQAFIVAREAVERAKKSGERVPLSVISAKTLYGPSAEAVLVLIGDLVRKRSEAEWRVLDAWAKHGLTLQREVAQELSISPQAVSRAIVRSGWQEEQSGRKAASVLLDLANAN